MDVMEDLLSFQEEHNQVLYNIALHKNEVDCIKERLQFVKVDGKEHTKALDKLRLTRQEISDMEFKARRLENYIKRFEMGIIYDDA
jgi:U3 small nucleolar RNA-associated protein 14